MRTRNRILIGTFGVFIALTFAWLLAFAAVVNRREPPSLKPPVARPEPRVFSPEADCFVASEIGKTYHLPDCFYAAKQMRHAIKFDTREAAEASGRRPCTNCLPVERSARSSPTAPHTQAR